MTRLLIVDDVALVREPIAAALAAQGYQTQVAGGGEECLAILSSDPPDLILLDLAMPRCDGLAVLRTMQAHPRHASIPVILLTEVTDRTSIMEAGRMGVRDCVLKSHFSLQELIQRIHRRLQPPSAPAVDMARTAPAQAQVQAPNSVPASQASTLTESVPHPREALRALRPLVTRTQMEASLTDVGEIKAISPAVAQLLALCRSEACSMDQVVSVVRQDHAIALKILKLANSVVYTRGDPVDSVQKAVSRIGLAQIQRAALTMSVIDQFSHGGDDDLNVADFWEHSLAVGLVAAQLVQARGGNLEQADLAFTTGVLHDVGRMVYKQELADLYRQVLQQAQQSQLPLEQVESRMLQINHADMMERLLVRWRMPRPLSAPIAMHHLSLANARQIAPKAITDIAVLAAANALAHALLLGSSGNDTLYPTTELIAELGVDHGAITQIIQHISDQTQDIKLSMLAQSTMAVRPSRREWLKDQLGAPLRPLVICESPAIDAVALLANVIQEPGPQPPNLAILHIPHLRQAAELGQRLLEAESAQPWGRLPLLVICPSDRAKLDGALTAGRRIEHLPMPFTLVRFVTAVRNLLSPSQIGP
jgi:HD-like signal output (HDOD) protein/DNA-binding response OmpR family regulator